MNKLILKAQERKITGRKVKRLRREGILPANIYGRGVKSSAVQVDLNEFLRVFKQAGETSLVELKVDGVEKPVLIHHVQLDPITQLPLHADFLQVDLKKKVVAKIPVELIGESPAEKRGLGTVVQYIDEIEVEALPTELLDKFEIDLAKLTEVDQLVAVKDLAVDKDKIEVKADPEQILVKVEPPKAPEEEIPMPTEEVVPEAPAGEGEAEGGKLEDEGSEKQGGEQKVP